MRRLAIVLCAVLGALVSAAPASAIHPLAPAYFCANPPGGLGNPPGLEPGGTHSAQSTLRPLFATGILVTFAPPTFDLTHPAAKLTTFNPMTGEATSDHPSIENCQNSQL